VNNTNRTYGAANPQFTATLQGLQNGDNISADLVCAADTNSPVGMYPITVNLSDPDDKLGYYNVTTNDGTLTVTPAALTVVANDSSRVYGATNPALSGTITGLENGDNISASFSTTATPASPVRCWRQVTQPIRRHGNRRRPASSSGMAVMVSAVISSPP